MRKNICIILILFYAVCVENLYAAEGVPFFRNYASAEYGAHNRNFDVVNGKNGIVYVANFEGLLYFDNSSWRIVYTPGYSRITRLFADSQGEIWAGGYNFVAKVTTDERRRMVLEPVVTDTGKLKVGEVVELFEERGSVFFRTQEGDRYRIVGKHICRVVSDAGIGSLWEEPYSVVRIQGTGDVEVNQSLRLSCGWQALASRSDGLIVLDGNGRKLYVLTEANGLCSNSVNRIAEGGNGILWGVTDNGIFSVSLPSMFSHYSSPEGLKGEVTTLQRYGGNLYIGTLQGLYRAEEGTVRRIPAVRQACWQLLSSADGKLYAATSEGLFEVNGETVRQLTHDYIQALAEDHEGKLYLAETDYISKLSRQNGKINHTRIADIKKVITLEYSRQSGVTAHDLSGNLYVKSDSGDNFIPTGYRSIDNHLACSKYSILWRTDAEGKCISAVDKRTNGQPERLNGYLTVLQDKTIRAIYPESDSLIWVGGDFGAIRLCFSAADAACRHLPQIFIRAVSIGEDSLYFGGSYVREDWDASGHNLSILKFGSRTKEIRFRFSSDALSALKKVEYQYRLEGYDDNWSSWGDVSEKTYTNLFYGSYTFKVRARDAFGQCSEVRAYHFTIRFPFYLKWYSLLLYFFLLAFIVFLCIKWRLRKLVKEKERLKDIVAARTKQIIEQKEEIEKKSDNLEKALGDLRHTQADLLRQEKMATVGKLTKGLIDRILNPLNYINNFSHLSSGLVSDLRNNFNSAKADMDPDTLDDSMDILDMMGSNLKKIEEHGGNTSRILKAMEEVLRERNKQKARMDLVALCRQALDMLGVYYKNEISRMQVALQTSFPVEELMIQGNEEQLGKTLMSLLNNGLYAISKKYAKQAYAPEIRLSMIIKNGVVFIHLKDNGIGIEESIQEQIFDPFFTTKTTGEAAGVGLYLSKDIVTSHHGNIHVESRKDEYTEFIIELPIE